MLTLLLPSAATAAAGQGPSSFADCEAMVRSDPDAFEGYDCFASLPRQNRQWDEARRRLRAMLAVEPENHLARLALGALESSQGHDAAERLLQEAAEGLAQQGREADEVGARLTLAVFYFIRGRGIEGHGQLERAAAVARGTGDPILLARVLNIQGRAASQENDLERAWRLFKQVESTIFPEGPPGMQAFCLAMLGILSEQMGRYEEAMRYHRQAADIQHEMGDYWAEARSRGNLAQHALYFWGEGEVSHQEALAVVRGALQAAVEAGTRSTEGRVRVFLGGLLEGAEAEEQFRAALAIEREIRDYSGIAMALRGLALQLAANERVEEAVAAVEEAIELGRRSADRAESAWSLLVRADLQRRLGDLEGAAATYRQAIAVIESIRDLQRDEVTQARLFSEWITAYQRLFGLLLEPAGVPPAPERLEEAFAIGERMRARALLDALDAAGATATLMPAGALQESRDAVLDDVSRLQQELLDSDLAPADRRRKLEELERLELEEAVLREEMARTDPSFAALRRPALTALREVQAALGEDEALLSFQVASWELRSVVSSTGRWGGGAWLLVLTRDEARIYPLPDRLEIEPAVRLYLGLLERRDASGEDAGVALFDLLLRPAVDDLTSTVGHLVVVPDGALHRLPFAALRPAPAEPPLGERFRISRVPSAATWLRWRRSAALSAEQPALVLADPVLAGHPDATAAEERSRDLAESLDLGPLPHARREAGSVARRLGRQTEVRLGPEASEHFLKQTSLGRFGVIHLAAHAVLDDANPARSAVLLAPGSGGEDGMLRIREVVGLDLDGRLVVLSACRSAAGAVLRGEGVLGLARAFFQAGAGAVVGSLWPLRDDEAAVFFSQFYRRLAEGESVGGALQGAQEERRGSGAPGMAWAGIVLLGDGEMVPFPGGLRPAIGSWQRSALVTLALGMIALALFILRRRMARTL